MFQLKVAGLLVAMLLSGSLANATDISEAIQGCISESKEDFEKVRPDNSSDTIVMVVCQGEPAQKLWEAVKFYSRDKGLSESDTRVKRLTRFFGNLAVPSQCNRSIEGAGGQGLNSYSCFIALDLNEAVIKAM